MPRFAYLLPALALLLVNSSAWAEACLIESTDQQVPIRMCQQNMTIPKQLFSNNFCHPNIPDRTFAISMIEACPEGAYGSCTGAHTEGVGYQQSIHYYSDAGDAPVLKAYCEKVSNGVWQAQPAP
ncbi:NADH:ubiquinone oxidoreductase [Halopseudomonas sp.]|uniref:NADH:ubiquinone oxidoreductase n=1 Tax=Halopseudomonas sp. TaxID=2901191 RepID=UPI0030019166